MLSRWSVVDPCASGDHDVVLKQFGGSDRTLDDGVVVRS